LNDRGFSLVELVIVILVFGIASIGLMLVFSTGTKKGADPLLANQALQLVQERMDTVLGDRLNPLRGFGYITSANYPAENPVAGFPGFSRTVTTSCVTAADLNTSAGVPPCASGYTHVTVAVVHAALGSVAAEALVTNY
jgi:prepilin-type N-terminal cleavage/methylation domain-containing protein